MKQSSQIELFLQNNSRYLERIKHSKKYQLFFAWRKKCRKLYQSYAAQTDIIKKNEACAEVLNAYENLWIMRARQKVRSITEDVKIWFRQFGKRHTIDQFDKKQKDYYSVVVIVKNEASYLREFILFYRATGANRIYLYDNDSSDNLLEVIEPYIKSGYVIYRKWPGSTIQTAAYRDAIRRTKRRTKWLAIVDADEFLFSPSGSTPEQLRKYESYPGVGVNWIVFGPDGHDKRPDGLVIDNYKATFQEKDAVINCHVKSIVQPKRVSTIHHTHFAEYKKGCFAVDTECDPIDNFSSFLENTGKAFTPRNYRNVLRINHYNTKSLEELRRKCDRGYADGAPNAIFQNMLRMFQEAPQTEDYTIESYANIVRKEIENE